MFNADASSVRQVSFNPIGNCPAYQVHRHIAAAVAEKQRKDRIQTAELIAQGTTTVPVRTGTDGGTHPVFLVKTSYVDAHSVSPSSDGTGGSSSSSQGSWSFGPLFGLAGTESRSATGGTSTQSGSFFSRLFRSGEEKKPEPAARTAAPVPKSEPARVTRIAAAKPGPQVKPQQETHARPLEPQPGQQAPAEQQKIAASVEPAELLSGAQRLVPIGSFESRWSAMR